MKSKTIALVLDQELLKRINDYRRKQPDMPNMSETLRFLIREHLDFIFPEIPDDFDKE